MPTFAKIQNGDLTGMCNITAVRGSVAQIWRTKPTTNPATNGKTEITAGRFHYEIGGSGLWTVSNAYPLPVGTAVSNGPIGRISRVRLARRQEVVWTAAANDSESVASWCVGNETYYGTATGYLQSTETPTDTETVAGAVMANLILPLDSTRDVRGNAFLSDIRTVGMDFTRGGPQMVEFSFTFTGASTPTLTGSSHPFVDTSFIASLELDNDGQAAMVLAARR
jgi:hypothetical protein